MNVDLGKFIGSFFSRKFGLAVFGVIQAVVGHRYSEIVPIISAYLVAEGVGDAAARYKGGTKSGV